MDPTPRPDTGTLEPAHRAAIAKQLFQTPDDPPERCFECDDPLAPLDAPVTYRSEEPDTVIALATRTYVAQVDALGRRIPWNCPFGPRRAPLDPACPGPARTPATAAGAQPWAGMNRSPTRALDADVLARRAGHAAACDQLDARLRAQFDVTRVPSTLEDLRRHRTEYRLRGVGPRVAFTATLWKISTDAVDPTIVRAMVDLAQIRRWSALRLGGQAAFRRMVWIEAAARGLPAHGYVPTRDDLHRVRRLRLARQHNDVGPWRDDDGDGGPNGAPAAASACAWQLELSLWLRDRQVPAGIAQAVMAAAGEPRRVHGLRAVGPDVRDDASARTAHAIVTAHAAPR